uniref:histone H1-like n=1 Tax=Pristiophorus japonicus TaxID=55135 RepID=UPI00398E84E2
MGRDQSAPATLPPPVAPVLPLSSPDEVGSLNIAGEVKKKRRPYRHKKFGCTVAEQIMKAVAATRQRRGLSMATMKKMLSASGCKVTRHDSRLSRAVRGLVAKCSMVRTAGDAIASVKLGNNVEVAAAKESQPAGQASRRRRAAVKRPAKKPKRPAAARKKRKVATKSRRGRRPVVLRKGARWKVTKVRRVARRPTETPAAQTPPASVKSEELVDHNTGSFQGR